MSEHTFARMLRPKSHSVPLWIAAESPPLPSTPHMPAPLMEPLAACTDIPGIFEAFGTFGVPADCAGLVNLAAIQGGTVAEGCEIDIATVQERAAPFGIDFQVPADNAWELVTLGDACPAFCFGHGVVAPCLAPAAGVFLTWGHVCAALVPPLRA